jgi:MFS transporter, ACS family, hexuronate transporter
MAEAISSLPENPAHSPSGSELYAPQPLKMTSVRWRICALLFFANTINYTDRQVLGVLAPFLQTKIGWTETQYGYIVVAFQVAYAIGLLFAGGIMDAIGVRLGYVLSIGLWSLAAISHAFVRTPLTFGVSRFFLGLGESGNFPAAIKTVAEWFPKKERALATGFFNCGTNFGATIAPAVVPWIAVTIGWQWAFLFTGFFSLLWVVLWWTTYKSPETHPRVNAAELAHIRSDPPEPARSFPWARLLVYRQSWALLIGKFLTDPVWWFLLFWGPKYFASTFGVKLTGLALPLIIIYNVAAVGSIVGGWLPAQLIKRGWTVRTARRISMLICALCVTPLTMVGQIHNMGLAIAILSLAAAAHQGWSANIFTLASDVFPRYAVGSVTGIAGFGGAAGGIVSAMLVGPLLDKYHNYFWPFLVAGTLYLIAWLIIRILIPRPEPIAQI